MDKQEEMRDKRKISKNKESVVQENRQKNRQKLKDGHISRQKEVIVPEEQKDTQKGK